MAADKCISKTPLQQLSCKESQKVQISFLLFCCAKSQNLLFGVDTLFVCLSCLFTFQNVSALASISSNSIE